MILLGYVSSRVEESRCDWSCARVHASESDPGLGNPLTRAHFLQRAGCGQPALGLGWRLQYLKGGLRVFGAPPNLNCTRLGVTFKASHCWLYFIHRIAACLHLEPVPPPGPLPCPQMELSGASLAGGCEDGPRLWIPEGTGCGLVARGAGPGGRGHQSELCSG